MFSTKMLLTLAFATIFLFIEAPLPVASDDASPAPAGAAPVKIGALYQCAHDLRGVVYALNEKQIMIVDFDYDGKAPAAHFTGMLRGAKGTLPFLNIREIQHKKPQLIENKLVI